MNVISSILFDTKIYNCILKMNNNKKVVTLTGHVDDQSNIDLWQQDQRPGDLCTNNYSWIKSEEHCSIKDGGLNIIKKIKEEFENFYNALKILTF